MRGVESDLIGIPWKIDGRSYDGVDCLGLALLAQKVINGREYDIGSPGEGLPFCERSQLIPGLINEFLTEATDNADQHGDVLVFRFQDTIHLGTYIEPRKVLNIMPDHFSQLTTLGRYWRERLVGRYRGVKKWP